MPNLYATPTEIKAALPDGLRAGQTKYDAELMRLAGEVARFVDNYCHRVFYPQSVTRYFHGQGGPALAIGDWVSIATVEVSDDDGATYTALAGSDWFASVAGDVNAPQSYTHLHVDANGDQSYWPRGQKSVKVIGVAGYTDDRAAAWEDTTDEVEDNPLSNSAVALTVNDALGAGLWGQAPRLQPGHLLRLESEFAEVVSVESGSSLTVVRGRGGTSAAQHAQNTQIDVWRPPEPVKQAVIIQLVRLFERAVQGFGDARATPDLSALVWVRALDPDVLARLAPYRRWVVA